MTSMWEGHGAGGVPAVDAHVAEPVRARRRLLAGSYTPSPRRDRVAAWVFGAVCAASVPYLVLTGRFAWFAFDEWDILAGTDGGRIGDYFVPHGGHWITLPIVAFKAMYAVVGLHSYRPYQLLAILTHVGVAVLLRQIMRNHDVDGWVATAAAAGFLFFGAGKNNVFWAFQITFEGGIAFGLIHLLLADHDGPVDRRDVFGVLAGTAALMCSGTGLVMLGVVSLAVFVRRGIWPAIVHTVPPAAVYAAWYVAQRPTTTSFTGSMAASVRAWIVRFVGDVFERLGHFTVLGVVLAAILVIGSTVAYRGGGFAGFRRSAAAPLAMLVGAVAFIASAAIERNVLGVAAASASRYLWVGAALVTPALGIAADAIARRGHLLHIGVVAALALAIPWNAYEFGQRNDGLFSHNYFVQQQAVTLGAPHSRYAHDVPPTVLPDPLYLLGDGLDIGWLLQAEKDGKLPDIGPLSPELESNLRLRLGVSQSRAILPVGVCTAYDAPIEVSTVRSQQFGIDTPVEISLLEGTETVASNRYQTLDGHVLTIELDDIHLRVSTAARGKPFVWCS